MSVFKLIEIVNIYVLVYDTSLWLQLVLAIWDTTFHIFNFFVWLRINGKLSVLEMGIWSILIIKSD